MTLKRQVLDGIQPVRRIGCLGNQFQIEHYLSNRQPHWMAPDQAGKGPCMALPVQGADASAIGKERQLPQWPGARQRRYCALEVTHSIRSGGTSALSDKVGKRAVHGRSGAAPGTPECLLSFRLQSGKHRTNALEVVRLRVFFRRENLIASLGGQLAHPLYIVLGKRKSENVARRLSGPPDAAAKSNPVPGAAARPAPRLAR